MRIGEAPLSIGDTTSRTSLLVQSFYLTTILEALIEVPWTSAKTRKELIQEAFEQNYTSFAFMYNLPADCARALELQTNEYFIVEKTYLYTDMPNAVLLYISNGRIGDPVAYKTEEPFPEYDNLSSMDQKFWEYIEIKIASKIALATSGKKELYKDLFGEALLIGQVASQATLSSSAAKKNGSTYWMNGIRGR